ncbi:hypothetical protein BSKO_08073 [Bryopsis sp. KO-2023]|nr:hypothetical protein BSKO_08073 [Bryopsis sp. KO-2023]
MQQPEVDSKIEHMCKFINQEALEKAKEIEDAANEEFNLEKLQLIEVEKANIRKEFERKESQAEVKKKIGFSKYVNETRLKVLQAREEAVQEVLGGAREDLVTLSKKKGEYKELVLKLLVQGMKKLGEERVLVRCREVDVKIVDGMLEPARSEYANVYGDSAPELSMDDERLKPPPTKKNHDPAFTCCGGVVLTSMDARIVLSNTLDDRLKIAFEENLPYIRQKLFT